MLLPINQNQIILKLRKYFQNGTKIVLQPWKCSMTILVGRRTIPYLNLTIFDETKVSSCHIPYTNNILYPVSSYCFLSHKKFFQAGNFNVNIRPDLLYFSIWGIYTTIYQNNNLWQAKTAKTLCTSLRILVSWNVILSTKISVVRLALKAKGQKYWMSLVNILMTNIGMIHI